MRGKFIPTFEHAHNIDVHAKKELTNRHSARYRKYVAISCYYSSGTGLYPRQLFPGVQISLEKRNKSSPVILFPLEKAIIPQKLRNQGPQTTVNGLFSD